VLGQCSDGDLYALIALIAPEVVIRNHHHEHVTELRGAEQVARCALQFRSLAPFVRPALINEWRASSRSTASSRSRSSPSRCKTGGRSRSTSSTPASSCRNSSGTFRSALPVADKPTEGKRRLLGL
jgi:hypothetical protein